MSVKIITDEISDISGDVASKFDIEVLPIQMIIEGKHMSAEDMSVEEMVKWIEENKKIPEFRGTSSDEYAKAFEKYTKRGNGIVCITAGSMAISNYDCALYASSRFPDANINIINTNRFSGNVGLHAVKAAKMAQRNCKAKEIVNACLASLEKNKQTALMDSLSFLEYAGNVPKIVAAGTNLFNAKFAFAMNKDDDRDAEIIGYSMDKAVKKFCKKLFMSLSNVDPETVFITYTISDDDYVSKVYKCAVDAEYFSDIILCRSSHFNTSFVGRNCMTVTYQMK